MGEHNHQSVYRCMVSNPLKVWTSEEIQGVTGLRPAQASGAVSYLVQTGHVRREGRGCLRVVTDAPPPVARACVRDKVLAWVQVNGPERWCRIVDVAKAIGAHTRTVRGAVVTLGRRRQLQHDGGWIALPSCTLPSPEAQKRRPRYTPSPALMAQVTAWLKAHPWGWWSGKALQDACGASWGLLDATLSSLPLPPEVQQASTLRGTVTAPVWRWQPEAPDTITPDRSLWDDPCCWGARVLRRAAKGVLWAPHGEAEGGSVSGYLAGHIYPSKLEGRPGWACLVLPPPGRDGHQRWADGVMVTDFVTKKEGARHIVRATFLALLLAEGLTDPYQVPASLVDQATPPTN